MLTRLLLSMAEAPGPERRAVELAFDAAYVLSEFCDVLSNLVDAAKTDHHYSKAEGRRFFTAAQAENVVSMARDSA